MPGRFDTDHMAVIIETFRLHRWQQIPIVELRLTTSAVPGSQGGRGVATSRGLDSRGWPGSVNLSASLAGLDSKVFNVRATASGWELVSVQRSLADR